MRGAVSRGRDVAVCRTGLGVESEGMGRTDAVTSRGGAEARVFFSSRKMSCMHVLPPPGGDANATWLRVLLTEPCSDVLWVELMKSSHHAPSLQTSSSLQRRQGHSSITPLHSFRPLLLPSFYPSFLPSTVFSSTPLRPPHVFYFEISPWAVGRTTSSLCFPNCSWVSPERQKMGAQYGDL